MGLVRKLFDSSFRWPTFPKKFYGHPKTQGWPAYSLLFLTYGFQHLTKSFTASAFLHLPMLFCKNPGENRANLTVHRPKTQSKPAPVLFSLHF
jgi:hypothetical protein